MKKLLLTSRLLLLLAGGLSAGWLVHAAVKTDAPVTDTVVTVPTTALAPGPNDGRIAYVTARLLEQNHYLRHPLDDDFSEKFLDRYLETLDPQHIHFTEGDLAEFEMYRTSLDNLTLTRNGVADTTPAYKIFNRFRQRLDERVAYAQALLKTEKFEFNTDERTLLNRKDAPYPHDLNEAKALWRQRLRYEYLQEKLGRAGAKTNAVATNNDAASATNSATASGAVEKKKTEAEEIVDTLNRRYNRNVHMFNEWDNEDVLELYLTSLAHVYDPHSDYFNSRQAENFSIQMSLALFGIGAELTSEDGYCTIRKLVAGGPAFKSKLIKDKDRIVAVAQSNTPPVDVVDMGLNKVVQMIRGPKGTEVSLTLIPPDSSGPRRVVTLVRDEIKLEDQAAKAKIIDLPTSAGKTVRLGVIDLPSFYATIDLGGGKKSNLPGDGDDTKATPRSTSEDVARLLAKFQRENVNGVILDLRRNGGGSLEEAVKLTGLFIKDGPVVQVAGPGDRVPQVDDDTDPTIQYDGPLIVLTSRFSASASEILAGALQDYGRALIVGDISTHGKGTVQNLNALRNWVQPTATATNDPGALKTTIKKFYRASGASTQLRGVNPDIVLPSVFNYSKEIGESALENPLEWDTIPSAKYDKVNRVAPFVADLLQRSNDRVATNQDFNYIREDIEQYRKLQADKTISLNEQQRLKEKDETDARLKARDKERLARKEPDQKVYELTLRQTQLPGLPPPVSKTNSVAASSGEQSSTAATAANNSTTSTPKAGPAASLVETDDAEETPPVVDATLDETERILMDYIGLMRQKSLATTQPAVSRAD